MTTSADYTVDQTTNSLVQSVYRRTLAPNSQNAIQPADLIILLDEEMRSTIIPLVLAAQEEYFVQNYDQAVQAGVFNYTIPTRAAFATWRDIVFVDQLGNEINMTNLSPEYLKITYPVGNMPPLYTFGFILQNDHIILWPNTIQTPTQYTLRMKIKRRPNSLTSYANCGQVQLINTGTKQVTLTAAGDGSWTTATTFDVIPNTPQFTSRGDDLTVSNVSSNVLTFNTLPTGLAVGDWVCPATLSPIPQVPFDLFPLLAQRGVIKMLEALGDSQNLQIAERRYQDMAVDFARTVSPRIQGTPKKIVNRTASFGWNYNRAISR
jgi:hypothetical protein